MRTRSDQHIQKVQTDTERIEKPYDEADPEYRIRLVEKDKKPLLKSVKSLARNDPEASLKKAVGELEKGIKEAHQRSRAEIKERSICIVNIKEAVTFYPCQLEDVTRDKGKDRIKHYISDKTLPGLIVTEDPVPVPEALASVHGDLKDFQ